MIVLSTHTPRGMPFRPNRVTNLLKAEETCNEIEGLVIKSVKNV